MEIACLAPSNEFDYTAILAEQFAERTGQTIRFEDFPLHNGEIPDNISYDAVIITGSEHHVYERERWVYESQLVLRSAMAEEIPILGICYGHQLLADTLGGTVQKMDEREMGYRDITLTEAGTQSKLFTDLNSSFKAFTSHQDYVTETPDDITLLADNENSIQAFQSDIFPAWGIQFHPEYNQTMAEQLLASKDLTEEQEQAIRATYTQQNITDARNSRTIFKNFLSYSQS